MDKNIIKENLSVGNKGIIDGLAQEIYRNVL